MKYIILINILCISIAGVEAQTLSRYNSFNYNVNEGLLQSNVLDMEFDANNSAWLSFTNGIQKFDGRNFTPIPVQHGLPDDKAVQFFRTHRGDLLISHSMGISRYDITHNIFRQIYISPKVLKNPSFFLGEDDGKVYMYSESGNIRSMDTENLSVTEETRTGFPDYSSNIAYYPRPSRNISEHRIVIKIKDTLFLWDLKKKKLVNKSPPIRHISSYFLYQRPGGEVLLYVHENPVILRSYNFTTGILKDMSSRKGGAQAFRSNVYLWDKKYLLSFYNQLFETDSGFTNIKSELVNLTNQPLAGNGTIAHLKEDNFGNLYLITINDGFKKIIKNNYPIKYYGTENRALNYAVTVLPDKKSNRILVGTYGSGLMIFDTGQHLIKHIPTLPGRDIPFSPAAIVKSNSGDYYMLVMNDFIWKLSADLSKVTPLKILDTMQGKKSGISYFSSIVYQNNNEAVGQSGERLYRINFAGNSATENYIMPTVTMTAFFYNSSILMHSNDELFFFDAATFKEKKRIPFPNTGGVRGFIKDDENNIFIGSNKGIFKIDSTGKILMRLNKEHGLPDECIYSMQVDNEGSLWCSTNKGVFKINRDKTILQIKKEDGLQENEFNTNASAKTADGELFFAGVNGLNSFYPASINSFTEKTKILFTRIRVNNAEPYKDSAIWNLKYIELPYNKNSLSFDYLVTGPDNPNRYVYQYKMKGVDNEWIQNEEMQTIRYFLQPGTYVFQVYASRVFDKNATPSTELVIVINPPFWKTWWFISIMSLLAIGLLMLGVNRYNKRKYSRQLRILENERQLKLERERISRDLHDSLGAYANAVLYKTELLQNENDTQKKSVLLQHLKYASRDIITSLRETIWALNKETYTAEECLVRIRNFIQPLSRYYSHVNFEVAGEPPEEIQFHSTKALNIVRVIQEAVTNSIKHSDAKNISIVSEVERAGVWKLIVNDNGNGFDAPATKKLELGNGLINMERRASEAGFEISVESDTTNGTSVILVIPYPNGV